MADSLATRLAKSAEAAIQQFKADRERERMAKMQEEKSKAEVETEEKPYQGGYGGKGDTYRKRLIEEQTD